MAFDLCAHGELRPLGAGSDCDDDCMSRTKPNHMEKKRLQHSCKCGAKAGEWCAKADGSTAQKLHARRGADAFRREREQAAPPSTQVPTQRST
jgi:hypothetical protein